MDREIAGRDDARGGEPLLAFAARTDEGEHRDAGKHGVTLLPQVTETISERRDSDMTQNFISK